MISYQTQDNTHTLLTKAVLTASTNLSSGSSRSDWAWEGVVDHIRELRVFDSYTERREGEEGGRGGRREGKKERRERRERGERGRNRGKGQKSEREREGGRREERKREISVANLLFSPYSCTMFSIHSYWE